MKEWMKQDTRINGWDFEYVENDYDDSFFSVEVMCSMTMTMTRCQNQIYGMQR